MLLDIGLGRYQNSGISEVKLRARTLPWGQQEPRMGLEQRGASLNLGSRNPPQGHVGDGWRLEGQGGGWWLVLAGEDEAQDGQDCGKYIAGDRV